LDENLLKLTNKSKDRDISFKNLIIATRASAKELPNISFTSNIWSYREAMTPKELPKSLAVIGSGAIGVEFANFYNSLGVDVTVIELADKILPVEDNEISDYAKNEFEKQGIKFQIGSYVESVEEKKDGCHLKVVSNSDKSVSNLKSDKVIMAVGITGNINNIGLENVNIKTENGHVITNENMQTNVSNIYAIGDVAGAPWLAHKASHEGIIAVDFLSGLSVHPINNNNIPGCVYSSPQVASVGLTEEKAKEQFQSIRVGKFPLVANGKAKAISNDTGFVKVIYDKETGELLGAHMIGEGVTELIHGYTIAKKHGRNGRRHH